MLEGGEFFEDLPRRVFWLPIINEVLQWGPGAPIKAINGRKYMGFTGFILFTPISGGIGPLPIVGAHLASIVRKITTTSSFGGICGVCLSLDFLVVGVPGYGRWWSTT